MRKSLNSIYIQTGWCHSSVGRAKDWKSLCPRFDSWWYHLKINDLQKCRSFFFSSRRSPLLCGSRTEPDLQCIRCTFGRRGDPKTGAWKLWRTVPGISFFAAVPVVFAVLYNNFFIFAYFKKAEKWLEWICFRNASGNYTFEGVVLVAVLQVCSKNWVHNCGNLHYKTAAA